MTTNNTPTILNGTDRDLRTPTVLTWLHTFAHDHQTVYEIATRYRTVQQLTGTPMATLLTSTQHPTTWLGRAVQHINDGHLPPETDTPNAVTRFDPRYPEQLRHTNGAPVVLHVAGDLHPGPAVSLAGSRYPTDAGAEAARAAGYACAIHGVTLVAMIDEGVGSIALEAALSIDGHVIAVYPRAFDLVGPQTATVARILDAGECVVTEMAPGTTANLITSLEAARLVAGLTNTLLLPDVGAHPAGGGVSVHAAIRNGNTLAVVDHGDPTVRSMGSAILVDPHLWTSSVFGANDRILDRVGRGLPAADHTLNTPAAVGDLIHTLANHDIPHH